MRVNLVLALAVIIAACSPSERGVRPPSDADDTCVIGTAGIGPIRPGMSVDEARRAFASATFERTSDGDGAALIGVMRAGEDLMTLYAGEDDPDAPIDWTREILAMETFSSSCSTSTGVHPGSLVVDVETILGKTRKITVSEIESREFIEFERQPTQWGFRLDYTGIFPPGARETMTFGPGAKIFSVAVMNDR